MKKVGEHVTIDFLGVKQEYSPDFYSKVIYKIAKKAGVEVLNIAENKFKAQGFTCVALLLITRPNSASCSNMLAGTSGITIVSLSPITELDDL